MYLSLDWLKDYVKIPKSVSAEDLGLKLTMHTVEIDDVVNEAEKFKSIVVGLLKEVKPHPDADKLQVAIVDAGEKGNLTIVCGAPNIKPGQKVPVALVGAVLPNGMEIKSAKIRGVASSGMLCAEDEIGLGSDHEGILILEKSAKVGQTLGEYLNLKDVIYEVDNKSITHRPDLWSHFGMAREIGAFLGTGFKKYESKIELKIDDKLKTDEEIEIEVRVVDSNLCPRYMALAVSGIKIERSPAWLEKRLTSVGVRPINNVVDVTNYVMLEMGQPMHAFDLSTIVKDGKKGNIIVRAAENGEEITTLDGVKRELDDQVLVIADDEKPIAIAGVMGGENSEVSDDSSSIVLESANFDFVSIRKTSQKFGLRTEASQRFEKCLDPNLCELALKRAAELLRKMCPDFTIVSQVTDRKDFSLFQGPIEIESSWLNKFIGIDLSSDRVIKILTDLGFSVEEKNEKFFVTIPTWRASKDVSIKEDIAEEISRIVGYDNIIVEMPKVEMNIPRKDDLRSFIRRIKNELSFSARLYEVYNYSFVGEEQLKKLGIDHTNHIRLKNPVVKHHSMCRQSLVPNMLLNVKTNQTRNENIRIYEIGSIYSSFEGQIQKDDTEIGKLPFQEKRAGILVAGNDPVDVFSEVKGIVSNMFKNYDLLLNFEATETSCNWSDGEMNALINVGTENFGSVSLLKEDICRKMGIKKQVAVVEVSLEKMLSAVKASKDKKYREYDKFPPLLRDLAFVINKKVKYSELRNEIISFHKYIYQVELFDEYVGDKLGDDKKSLAFKITYQTEKTLAGVEVDVIQEKLLDHLKDRFDAVLRDF